MHKYFLIYYTRGNELTGTNYTQITLNFEITKTTISRVELKLKKALKAEKVVILSYKEI